MNLTEASLFSVPYTPLGNSYISKIARIIRACECCKNLMIGIYSLDTNRLLFCNNSFKKILADSYIQFLQRGWEFWYSLIDPGEKAFVKDHISQFCSPPYSVDQMVIKYHITDLNLNMICIKHEMLLHQFDRHIFAVSYLFDVSGKEAIESCFTQNARPLFIGSSKEEELSISAREKEVLLLIAEGYSSKEIADLLCISNHTAISHRKNLIEKFQVKNTAHLIKKASRFVCL